MNLAGVGEINGTDLRLRRNEIKNNESKCVKHGDATVGLRLILCNLTRRAVGRSVEQ